jgi:tetratricopeptide (TPR) repeat protein
MKRLAITLCSLLVALSASASGFPKMPAAPELTPEQKAVEKFNAGTSHLEKAVKFEKENPEKLQAKIRTEYEKAARDFESATRLKANFYQAFTQLGFALRKSGKYDEALRAYDAALSIVPNLSPALEYRAEAYLGLNRIDEAKAAYVLLFSGDRPRADELATAMKQWLEKRRTEPGPVAQETIESFEKWLSERQQIAVQTSDLAGGPKRSW